MSGLYPHPRKDGRHQKRYARMQKLEEAINNNGDKSIDKLLADFCYYEGVDLRKLREYLKILLACERITKEQLEKSKLIEFRVSTTD